MSKIPICPFNYTLLINLTVLLFSAFLMLLFVLFPGTSNFEERLPSGQLSTIPWRRSGVKYTNNEAYFDVIEEIDAIVDKSGRKNLPSCVQ